MALYPASIVWSENVQLIDSAAFNIDMNSTEVQLYISRRHDELNYYMQSIKSFLFQDPEH